MSIPESDVPPDPADHNSLVSAYRDVVERYRGPANGTPPDAPVRSARTRPWFAAVGVLATLALVYVWGVRPGWLFSLDAIPAQTPEQEDASLRLGLYLQYHRVMDYRKATGRIPATLEAAGDVEEGVVYTVTGDSTFQLTASNERLSLQLNQSDDPARLLEGSPVEGKKVVP